MLAGEKFWALNRQLDAVDAPEGMVGGVAEVFPTTFHFTVAGLDRR